jgi:hypothetical protein
MMAGRNQHVILHIVLLSESLYTKLEFLCDNIELEIKEVKLARDILAR